MAVEADQTLGGGYTVQHTDDASRKGILKHITLLTNVTPIHLILKITKGKKKVHGRSSREITHNLPGVLSQWGPRTCACFFQLQCVIRGGGGVLSTRISHLDLCVGGFPQRHSSVQHLPNQPQLLKVQPAEQNKSSTTSHTVRINQLITVYCGAKASVQDQFYQTGYSKGLRDYLPSLGQG